MLIKKLFFPGTFDEAFIYMQKLLLLNEEGSFFYVDLDIVCAELEAQVQDDVRFAPTLLFSQRGLLHSKPIQSVLSNNRVRQAVKAAVVNFPDELPMKPDYVWYVGDTGIESPLALHIYYSRAYVGADDGLFDVDLDIQTNKREVGFEEVSKRHEAMTSAISTAFGSINASCGEEGLFTTFGEFGRMKRTEFWTGEFNSFAGRSLRTSWLFNNLLNYQTSTNVEYKILSTVSDAKRERDPESKSRERTAKGYAETQRLTDIVDNRPTLMSLFNTGSFLLAQYNNLEVKRIQLTKSRMTGRVETRSESLTPLKGSRIVSVKAIENHAVVEFYDTIYLITNNNITKLLDGEALSVRTYPDSKRAQHLITIVVEAGVYVVSLFDESKML